MAKGIKALYLKIRSKIFRERIPERKALQRMFAGKSGLEIGGPSRIFRNHGFIPLYRIVKKLDGCNFSTATLWEASIQDGASYVYHKHKQKGIQYVSEATDLNRMSDSTYDFVLSSNCLEHCANPMKALEEWIRVLKKNGLLLLVLPNKAFCFDHNRSVTPFTHLLNDYQTNVTEADLTHLDEILSLHDLSMDIPAGSFEQFKARSLKNFDNRALHQHVFDLQLLSELFAYFKLEVLQTHEGREFTILGRKKGV